MSNRLADEQSPYLVQHENNPVEWYPWSAEAFEKAKREDKPVFLSIGYSTCHWCHVMAHESFEDEEVARLMNETFVSVKVDREERPDVDGVYMTVCQMMTGHGGWPLTIIMTPDKKPFHAATYIPRESRYGRIGMMDLVPRIKTVWEDQRQEVLDSAEYVTSALRRSPDASKPGESPGEEILAQAFEDLRGRFDPLHGGFGQAPKFPSVSNLLFLLRSWKRTDESAALEMVVKTLEQMRLGGIYDHLGFGFHRYATDRHWLLPHFEKMLYDQAMLAMAYTEAYQATSRRDFRETVGEIIMYVMRDMKAPEGAFYSAEDADSEGREGKFYVWSVEQVQEILSSTDAQLFADAYSLAAEGNFEEEATRRRTGENVLHLKEPLSTQAKARGENPQDFESRFAAARLKLFEARGERIRPGLDDKILTDWNGLMIAALSKAAAALEAEAYAEAASQAASFVLEHLRDERGRLLHRYRKGEAAVTGNLDDYAYFIWGLLELYEATFATQLLKTAAELMDQQIKHFWDDSNGGFFFTADDAEELISRRKEFYDGALPSGNAVSMLNLLRLNRITARTDYQDRADSIARAAGVGRMPSGFTGLLSAVDFAVGPSKEIVLAGKRDAPETQTLLRTVRGFFLPNKVILLHDDDGLADLAPYVADQRPLNGQTAAYVCHDFRCEAPVTSDDELREILSSR